MPKRKTTRRALGLLACAGIALDAVVDAQESQKQTGPEKVVQIVAQRFSYTPNEIVLQAGQPAVLAFTALDFTHGFSIPRLKIRADLPPGQVTRVRLTPEKPGVYEFLCDNFCGAGHEQMNGKIIVKE
jgi:cytochrome c oxidase subunit II